MHRTSILERSLDQLLTSSIPRNVCRSCSLRAAASQRRQIQHSANRSAGLFSSLWGGKKDEVKNEVVAETNPGSSTVKKGKKVKPVEPTAEDDPNYVQAIMGEGLEHVGGAKWIEDQNDPLDEYTG